MDLNYLIDQFKKLEMEISEKQIDQLVKYYNMLVEKNKVMNLTAITEWKDVVLKHFVDSAAVGKHIELTTQSIADIGTGAGFPGIPLKILYPDTTVLLVDSLNKRVKFLNEVIEELGIQKIEAVHGRAEEIGHNPLYREQFDLCVSRAVANLSTLSEYCLPVVKTGGYFISYKSGNIQEEEQNAKGAVFKLGGKIDRVDTFTLPDSDIERSFVFIAKKSKTSKKYPRTAGKPSKEPLS